mmetsp:Transcript_5376/g.15682  ORF Transcript_5376/g.15682 Transcript_5376/m.15682 type:complete len:1111 (-) Transcript_5376:959-4291(-)
MNGEIAAGGGGAAASHHVPAPSSGGLPPGGLPLLQPAAAVAQSNLPPHSSDPDEESRRVLMALDAVFAGHTSQPGTDRGGKDDGGGAAVGGSRDAADRYLTSFQRHTVSWVVCDRLLAADAATGNGHGPLSRSNPAQQQQARFFAAQTLHAKCRCDASQLPAESLPSLRDSLTNHFTGYAAALSQGPSGGSSRALVTRLAMALSALSVQMSWLTVIPDVSHNILNPRPELAPAVLELFKLLPEECGSDRLILEDERRRRDFGFRLRDEGGSILDFLVQMAQSEGDADVTKKEALLQTFHSWIRYVPLPPQLLQSTPLIDWTFAVLDRPHDGDNAELFEVAVDVVVEVLRMYPSDRPVNEGLVMRMIPLAMNLGRKGATAVAAGAAVPAAPTADDGPFRCALHEKDEDLLRGYCRIFTEMGESYISLIVSHEEMNQERLVDLVLDCAEIPDKEIANITLHFWYKFVSWLESLEPLEYRYHMIDHYTPQLLRLLSTCTLLLRYPVDIDSLPDDRVDDVQRDRYYVSDVIEDCCRLLGGHVVLRNVGDRLKEECQRVSTLVPPERRGAEWHGIESCLYAIRSVARYIADEEQDVLPFVMGLIPQLPPDVRQLRCTASTLIGKYALWLDSHTVHLEPLMPYLAQGLSTPQCTSAAAVAIKELCEGCNKQMCMGDPVLQLYDGISAAQQEAHRQHAHPVLELRDELEVLEGACKAVSRQLMEEMSSGRRTPEELGAATTAYVNRIVQPIGQRLAAEAADGAVGHPRAAIAEVERLTVVIRYLDVPHSASRTADDAAAAAGVAKLGSKASFIMDLMSESWALLDAVSQKYPRDIHLAEKLCRLHKHVMRGVGPGAFQPMLEPLRVQLVRNFSQSHLSPYLYAASVCIAEFGSDPAMVPLLVGMLTDLSAAVFGMLRTRDDFTSHPDVVEEFFFLAGRAMTHCPEQVVISPLLNSLLQCAAVGMELDHRDANSGTLNFIEGTVSYGLRLQRVGGGGAAVEAHQACREALEKAVVAEGQPLVTNLASAILGDLPLYRLDNSRGSVAGVLFSLNELCPVLLMQWLTPALMQAPPTAKDLFLQSLQDRAPRDEFDTSLRQFAKVCERNRKLRGNSPASSV